MGHFEDLWGEVEVMVVVVVVGCQERVVPCQTDNQVRHTRYRLGEKAIGMGRFEDLWGEVEMAVVVVVVVGSCYEED